MGTYILIYSTIAIVLGLVFTIQAIRNAEDDPETFDHFKNEGKYQKPANWKVGKMPASDKEKDTLQFFVPRQKTVYHLLHLN
jgi:hypothetical protein